MNEGIFQRLDDDMLSIRYEQASNLEVEHTVAPPSRSSTLSANFACA
jgi:hypothetical protein